MFSQIKPVRAMKNKKIMPSSRIFCFTFILTLASTVLACAATASAKASNFNPIIKEDTEGFVLIKNKSPEEMFDDATYLYKEKRYQEANILYYRVENSTLDPSLRHLARLSRELTDLFLKAERSDPTESAKAIRQAENINAILELLNAIKSKCEKSKTNILKLI